MHELNPAHQTTTTATLCKLGGTAALLVPLLYITSGIITGIGYNTSPVPTDVLDWFTLLQSNPVLGLVYLGIQDSLIAILSIPLFLALYYTLKKDNKARLLVTVAFAFIGITIYLAMQTSCSMLALSSRYFKALTDIRRSLTINGAEALLTDSRATLGTFFLWVAALAISLFMLRSKVFGKPAAIIGCGGFLLLLIGTPVNAGYTDTDIAGNVWDNFIIAVSYTGGGLLSLTWYVLVGIKLWKIGRDSSLLTGGSQNLPNR